ncbi:hypothetical protein N474_11980 [Pseudoalteromonas luteoviolacea CPMOR-2]|uniref:ABC transporter substrate-binding protein n=1 Tax=Pseudoalteromonas luteoviolacea DSM 6061 TaxID=1365250 RepID=A0A166XUE6_9GAMM|nr:ABC transporter substrate binding protein [Pseudoalteromonas luteoviolacea]KZN40917.1 hypothetical protein N475_00655 [Pseudoalteromonas luteoviolacea DSM 6061]KZN56459.1 hypothetical protein N474_11980 [Pseudoalteromonas luteoviolacea CPMOR-2]MBE0386366.1 putative ABC transport system substrate-binding protein [Pseudoalteromonas luteoviolacea DSM 6061]
MFLSKWLWACGFIMASTLALAGPKKILIVETLPVPIVTKQTQHIFEELHRLDMDLDIAVFNGDGQSEKITSHILEQIECGCFDLLITNGTLASKIGKKLLTGKGIPMVFVTVADPHGAGLVPTSQSSPINFITGSIYSVGRGTKLEIVNQLLKARQTNIGVIATSYPAALTDIDKLESIATNYQLINFTKRVIKYRDRNEVELDETYHQALEAAASIAPQVDFFWSVNGPFSERSDFVHQMSMLKPVLYGANLNSVKQGALFTVIPDIQSTAEQTAGIIREIFSGVSPAMIKVQAAPRKILAFNIRTATQLGIVIPYDLLSIAGRNVFH